MQLKYLIAAFASLALASAVAIPEEASPTFVCGCTNACKIANKPGMLCPEYCDPQYECPPPTPTQTPIRVTETCGPCLNDCLVGCPDLRLCRCANICDPKYFCPTTTAKPITVRPTLTRATTASPKPTFVCGCTNDCIISCPPGKSCICPQYCDPKYECPIATIKPTRITLPTPVPTVRCGCTNDCKINCAPGSNCICPDYCDPKYECRAATLATYLTKRVASVIRPTTLPSGIPCGCHNDCTISCNKRGCACPAWCDPKYACKAVI